MYEITYKNSCDEGSIVTVTAEKDGISGSATGKVRDFITLRKVDIDIAIINFSVHEFGFIPGVIALLSSTGTFLFLKKRALIN